MKIAVAVTTAPRDTETLSNCLISLRGAGFAQPTVFAEPGSDLSGVTDEKVIQRSFKYGAWRNWIYTAKAMCLSKVDAVFMVQDDTVFAPGSEACLQRDLWPHKKVGYVQVAVSSGYSRKAPNQGLNEVEATSVLGAWAVIFPRDVLEKIVELGLSHGWRGLHSDAVERVADKRKAIDPFIGEACALLDRKAFVFNPSLAEHVAQSDNSTLGHDEVTGWRLKIRSGLNHQRNKDITKVMPNGKSLKSEEVEQYTPDVSVVIPIAGDCWDLVESCLEAVWRHGTYVAQVVIVDNGTDGIGERAVKRLEELHIEVCLIRNETNLGFSVAVNQGIKSSGEYHVLLLNDDCRLSSGCLKKLRESLVPEIAAIGPVTNDKGLQSTKIQTRRTQFVSGRITDEQVLSFFCVLLNASVLASVGLLDENYSSGLMADNEWCERAVGMGLKVRVHGGAFAEHDHKQTFERLGMDRTKLHQEAIQYHG
jgi:GT2 family glycosyltransferase